MLDFQHFADKSIVQIHWILCCCYFHCVRIFGHHQYSLCHPYSTKYPTGIRTIQTVFAVSENSNFGLTIRILLEIAALGQHLNTLLEHQQQILFPIIVNVSIFHSFSTQFLVKNPEISHPSTDLF